MLERPTFGLVKGDRVALLGDSLTANPAGYSARVIRRLGEEGIEAVNAGVGGDKTPTALARLRSDVIARKPDAVSIFLGTNDAAIGPGIWVDEPRVPPAAYAATLQWILHLCRLEGIRKFSITPPLYRFEGPAYADYGDGMREYCLAARQVAEDSRVCFVPADAAFAREWALNPGRGGLLLTTDGVHLAERGCEILANAMLSSWGFPAA